MQIPFNRPYLTGNELKYIEDCILSTQHGGTISGDGKYTKLVQEFFQSKFGARKALMTTSCTSALELATRPIRFLQRSIPFYSQAQNRCLRIFVKIP
jgi:dTDP-4-amino-4,6-dideoxygalactose transaminase